METPREPKGLSVTLSWNGAGGARSRSFSPGSALRIAAAASLCGLCFKVGLWAGRLESQEPRPASAVVVVEAAAKSPLPENAGSAPGGVPGEKDVITPLNVRDPAALVMGLPEPAPPRARASDESDVPEAAPPPKVYKRAKDIKPSRRF